MIHSTFSASARIRHAVVCCLLTLGLAACGSGGSASSSSPAALVSPNVGVIDRNTSSTGTQNATAPQTNTAAPDQSPPAVASNPPSAPTTGSATLDWVPPTQNSDGTTLTNLAGYYVYSGTSPDNLTESVKVTNPGLSAFTVSNLTSGTWYFAVSSYSSSGVESTRTGVISTKI
jgi:hypothetical protein